MASRQSLRKIGEEAFRLIDQAEEKRRFLYHPTHPTVHYLQPPQVSNGHLSPPLGQNGYHFELIPAPVSDKEDRGGVMDCYEAARRFGGMVVSDYYPNRKMAVKRNNRAY